MDSIKPQIAVVTAIDGTIRAFLMPQIRAMQRDGFGVLGVCSPGEGVAKLEAQGLEMHPVLIPRSIRPLADLSALIRLWRIFRRRGVKIVHTHTPMAALLGQVAAILARVPIRITTVHGLFYVAFPPGIRRTVYRLIELTVCRTATYVFCVSSEDVPVIRKHLAADRVEATGNGIDLSRFDPARFSKEHQRQIRSELGIPDNAFVVGIVARMVKEKGICELLEAMGTVRQSAPDAHLLLIGPTDTSRGDEVTAALSEQYGVGAGCHWTGERQDIPELLAAMDVYCLPSYREGYPVSVIEAGAMGLPCVVSDIRGCREAVADGVNGLLVPPRQAAPLAQAILKLYRDAALRGRMAVEARRRAELLFDERRIVEQIMSVYRRFVPGIMVSSGSEKA